MTGNVNIIDDYAFRTLLCKGVKYIVNKALRIKLTFTKQNFKHHC